MKLKDALDNYYFHTEKLSDVCRQLAFAAIAMIWLFGLGAQTDAKLPHDLVLPALLVVGSLSADVLHYVSSSLVWGRFHRVKEDTVKPETEFKAPRWLNWPALTFMYVKVGLLAVAYGSLGIYLARRLL